MVADRLSVMGLRDWFIRREAREEVKKAQAYLAGIKGGEMGSFEVWAKGALVAIGGGICTALADALANGASFDSAGLRHMGGAAIAGGAVALAAYLKQSPLPPKWDGTDRRTP